MRLYHVVTAVLFATACLFFIVCAPAQKKEPLQVAQQMVQEGIDSLDYWLQQQWMPAVASATDTTGLAESFAKGRKLYKKIEWAIEYFYPSTARQINGPALPEIEAEEHIVIEPGGFQVMEELLFAEPNSLQLPALRRESNKLKSMLVRAKQLWTGHKWRNDQIFDALRQELYRIITLGISGFDTPISLTGIAETGVALQSVEQVLSLYGVEPSIQKLLQQARVMVARLDSFDEFDRMAFITNYIDPLTTKILQWQQQLKIPVLTGISALRGDAPTLFADRAFDVNYFTPDAWSHLSDKKIALGKRLFYDNVLSSSNTVSCASCHQPAKAFTDGLTKSAALGSTGFLLRNTPSLINAGLQKGLFYDLRASYLEDQVKNVVENKDEIHGSLQTAAIKLKQDSSYYRQFRDAFNFTTDTIDERFIMIALASYVRSLTSFNARFDAYMRGDTVKMDRQEIKGFNLFMGKAKCGICHFMPLFNGTVPPSFVNTESEVIGVPSAVNSKTIDTDAGRYIIHQIPNFRYAFKIPTLRNIALTAPYMHNGVYRTLEEVIDFYDKGGGNGLGMQLEYQTLPEEPLHLTAEEKRSLVAFLHTLTDTTAAGQ